MLETKKELADRLKISIRTLERWLKRPDLGLVKRKIGRIVRIDASGFEMPADLPSEPEDAQ